MSARLAAVAERSGRDLAYLAIGGLTAVLAFAVWVTAVTVTLSLLVFIVGLPVFLLSAIAFRWTAELDRRNAVLALGRPLRGHYREHRGERFLDRLRSTAADWQTWRDLAWLVVHSAVGFAFGVLAVTLVAQTIGLLLMPAWYWALPEGANLGFVNVDSLGAAFLATLGSIPAAAITVLLLRGMTIGEARLAEALLEGGAPGTAEAPATAASGEGPSRRLPEAESALGMQAVVSGLLALLVTAIWAATGAGYFWPAWAYLALLIPLGLNAGLREAMRVAPAWRALAVQGVISALIVGVAIAVWALAGFGGFWPIWTILAVATAFALHFLWRRVFPGERERELSERVETLTRTRRGALDVQSAELRRIERDLHDGAQARLVALSMQLGRAEQGLDDNPEAAELVRAARSEAGAAIAELRDLARGIAPPILADRGLPAAVEALGRRSPVPVTIEAELVQRPPAVIETAAYFVCAEALTNVAKHAPEAAATVRINGGADVLRVEVADDGPGGADPAGGGLSGLRARVAALDGELRVSSPPGGGTTIEVELPCGS
ncbi:MAG TPA: sensor domain-containing protein [Solirubrobacterales bacterium]|jgi:signal transduction histidine kinase